MATTVTEYTNPDWQAVATGAGEFLVEVSTDFYYAYGASAPAAKDIGYTGRSGAPMPPVVLNASRSLYIRPRSTGALGPWRVVVTGASQ